MYGSTFTGFCWVASGLGLQRVTGDGEFGGRGRWSVFDDDEGRSWHKPKRHGTFGGVFVHVLGAINGAAFVIKAKPLEAFRGLSGTTTRDFSPLRSSPCRLAV